MKLLIKRFSALIFAASLFISMPAAGQKFLAIDKSGKVNRLRFYVNDKINIRLTDESFFRSGYIDAIGDTSFIFDGKNIPLQWVDAILVYKNKGGHAFLKEASAKLPIAAAFLLLLTATNSIISGSYPIIPPTILIISGAMVATGIILYPLTFRVYQVKKHPLKIIDVTIAPKDN